MGNIQPVSVNPEFLYVPQPCIHPPCIQICVSAVPVKITHPPGTSQKPVRVFFYKRAVLHDAMGYYIQKNFDSAAMGTLYEMPELRLCPQTRVDAVRTDTRIFCPDIIKMAFVAELMAGKPDSINPQLLQIRQLLFHGSKGARLRTIR